jgi:osmotically-inducible protein OsmY
MDVEPRPNQHGSGVEGGQRHLESLVRADLRRSSYDEVGRVTCTLNDRVLTLTGRVSSYYLKQVAQRIVLDRLEGIVTVVNELQVVP